MNRSPSGERHVDILLVEDNAAHAELVLRSLENHRIANTVYHVTDGEAALEFLFEPRASEDRLQVDLVLLDLRLPKVDGLEVLRRIKESEGLKRLPVVILTTSEAERDVTGAYTHHANSYVTKPMDYQQFTDLMEQLGYYWLGWNESPRV